MRYMLNAKYEAEGKKKVFQSGSFCYSEQTKEQPYLYDLYLELLIQITLYRSLPTTCCFPMKARSTSGYGNESLCDAWMASIPPASQ
mmetsp:Transcript_3442/g.8103  ORF Transcript_3442/g.8103 Transcript_3442/m.8103 type:complete len:87 (+) Transcript_3442:246-506(+)